MESVRQRAMKEFKVESTPTFFINGTQVTGAVSIEEFAKVIDPLSQGRIRVFRPGAGRAWRDVFVPPGARKVWKTAFAAARPLLIRARRFILRPMRHKRPSLRGYAPDRITILQKIDQNIVGGLKHETYAAAPARVQVVRRADRFPDRAGADRRGRAERLRQIQSGRSAALGDGRVLVQVHARRLDGRGDFLRHQ